MEQSDIKRYDWDNVDYTKISLVISLCKKIRDYLWERNDKATGIPCVLGFGPMHNFLINAFSIYHTEWDARTKGAEVMFFVAVPKEYHSEKAKCFHLILDGEIPKDSAISFHFSKKDRIRKDIMLCCRHAISDEMLTIKFSHLGEQCRYTGTKLNALNSVVHHERPYFADIVDDWVNQNGGEKEIHKYVSPALNGGTITHFSDIMVEESFTNFHRNKANLIVISRKAHKMIHSKKNKNDGQD